MGTVFDKFIDVEFEEYMTQDQAMILWKQSQAQRDMNLLVSNLTGTMNPQQWGAFVDSKTNKRLIRTPPTGVKPDIAVSAEFLPSMRTKKVKLSLKNMDFDIDISKLSWVRIHMGYFLGGSIMFRGAIMNSYMENPNPNGRTVFELMDCGVIGMAMTPQNTYLSTAGKSWLATFKDFCEAQPQKYTVECSANDAEVLDKIPMPFPISTRKFETMNIAVDYFKQAIVLQMERPPYNLRAPEISSNADGTGYHVELKDSGPANLPSYDEVKSVNYTGGSIQVKSIFRPDILPLQKFYIDPKYFKGRFNNQNIFDVNNLVGNTAIGMNPEGVYFCLTQSINFDTGSTNDMLVTGVSAKCDLKQQDSYKALIQQITTAGKDTYFLDPAPDLLASWVVKRDADGEPVTQEPEAALFVADTAEAPEYTTGDLPPAQVEAGKEAEIDNPDYDFLEKWRTADFLQGGTKIEIEMDEPRSSWASVSVFAYYKDDNYNAYQDRMKELDEKAHKKTGFFYDAFGMQYWVYGIMIQMMNQNNKADTDLYGHPYTKKNARINSIAIRDFKKSFMYFPDPAKVLKNDPKLIEFCKEVSEHYKKTDPFISDQMKTFLKAIKMLKEDW
jgi:hypothetical protein